MLADGRASCGHAGIYPFIRESGPSQSTRPVNVYFLRFIIRQPQYDAIFYSKGPVNGKLSGEVAKNVLIESRVPFEVLGQIWELSDMDRDGELDADEFALAMHLINSALAGRPIPAQVRSAGCRPPARLCGRASVL